MGDGSMFWVVVGVTTYILSGGGWWCIYFGWWCIVVDLFWVVVGGGQFVLGGSGWWQVYFG